jgi:hypothetical protein
MNNLIQIDKKLNLTFLQVTEWMEAHPTLIIENDYKQRIVAKQYAKFMRNRFADGTIDPNATATVRSIDLEIIEEHHKIEFSGWKKPN